MNASCARCLGCISIYCFVKCQRKCSAASPCAHVQTQQERTGTCRNWRRKRRTVVLQTGATGFACKNTGHRFCVGESTLCQPKFYDGRHLDMERLHTSLFLCLGSHKPGPDSPRKYATPTVYAKRLNVCSMNPAPWSLSIKLNVFIHSDHPRKRSNASAFFSQQRKVLRQGHVAQALQTTSVSNLAVVPRGLQNRSFFQKSCLYALRHTIISELP